MSKLLNAYSAFLAKRPIQGNVVTAVVSPSRPVHLIIIPSVLVLLVGWTRMADPKFFARRLPFHPSLIFDRL